MDQDGADAFFCSAQADRTAIIDERGGHTYAGLLQASARIASRLLGGSNDLREERVAFLAPPGFAWAAAWLGIWRAGGIAVPLSPQHPLPEIDFVVENSRAHLLLVDSELGDVIRGLTPGRSAKVVGIPEALAAPAGPLPEVTLDRRAMIVYTSGTTSRPKGVVTTHRNIRSQIMTLIEAWRWTAADVALHVLPLHHIHGIINVLGCALRAGATCRMLPRFDAARVWEALEDGDVTVFMAVPTIYNRLIAAWEAAGPAERRRMSEAATRLRLMVSGSAALPVSTLEAWRNITGHILLERYGMTEIGMALSNPLHGPRRPGYVGTPLPGVDIRLTRESAGGAEPGEGGEIEVRGDSVFLEYWDNPDATRAAFREGWFRTGDMAVVEDGCYRILGRLSVDIIKTGGFKVSAVEIEEVLRTHPSVVDCAVVGVEDPEWGECVCAAAELRAAGDIEGIRSWAKERLAPYKAPRRVLAVDSLPRNPLGKVIKTKVKKLFRLGRESDGDGHGRD